MIKIYGWAQWIEEFVKGYQMLLIFLFYITISFVICIMNSGNAPIPIKLINIMGQFFFFILLMGIGVSIVKNLYYEFQARVFQIPSYVG
jgi:hypothetical protein